MVSDYKFHFFCKRLKKEKWRLGKDLSPAMMLLIFHCCLWMSHLWKPSVGCKELSGRMVSPGSPAVPWNSPVSLQTSLQMLLSVQTL